MSKRWKVNFFSKKKKRKCANFDSKCAHNFFEAANSLETLSILKPICELSEFFFNKIKFWPTGISQCSKMSTLKKISVQKIENHDKSWILIESRLKMEWTSQNISDEENRQHHITLTIPLREKCPNTEFFLVRIFPHLDWISLYNEYLSVFRLNAGKYGSEKTLYLDTFRAVYLGLSYLHKLLWVWYHSKQFLKMNLLHFSQNVEIFLIEGLPLVFFLDPQTAQHFLVNTCFLESVSPSIEDHSLALVAVCWQGKHFQLILHQLKFVSIREWDFVAITYGLCTCDQDLVLYHERLLYFWLLKGQAICKILFSTTSKSCSWKHTVTKISDKGQLHSYTCCIPRLFHIIDIIVISPSHFTLLSTMYDG